jgi:YHS domain-containing protein
VAKDVVCGMKVDEATAQWKSEYKGEIYYICAPGCKRAFETDQKRYLRDLNTQLNRSGDGIQLRRT